MDRDEFMELVYETFADEPDNVLANGIIEAADAYVEYEKAQLSKEDATSDLISRQAAIDALDKQIKQCCKALGSFSLSDVDKHAVEVEMASIRAYREMLEYLPTVQPELTDIDAREAVYNLAEKIGIHQLFALTVELRGEPIQPEPQWIPVSERLPESGAYCLFTVFEHDSELEATTIETVYGCFNDYGERRYWSWEDEFGKCCIEGEEQLDGYHDEIIEKVLAWMPLPEPYKPNNE